MTNHPKIGIRPIIDGRRRGVRESLEDQTMNMARRVAALYEAELRYIDGNPVECVIADSTIGGVAEAQATAEKFRRENVGLTLSVTPCWAYGTETIDMDRTIPHAIWGFNGSERPGAVYLAAALAGHTQLGIPAFGIYGEHVQDADDETIPEEVRQRLLDYAVCGLAVAQMKGRSYLSMGAVSMGIAGSVVKDEFWTKYLGMRNEYIDMGEFARRVNEEIYDVEEYERALAWVRENFRQGEDFNPPHNQKPERHDDWWAYSVKMTLIARDLMAGNPRLAEKGWGEEALGRGAIAAGFQGQRQWTDGFPNGDLMETILNTTFDWNGTRAPHILATENDSLNGASMLFNHLLTNTSQLFSDVRTYWSAESVERVTGHRLEGRAAGASSTCATPGPPPSTAPSPRCARASTSSNPGGKSPRRTRRPCWRAPPSTRPPTSTSPAEACPPTSVPPATCPSRCAASTWWMDSVPCSRSPRAGPWSCRRGRNRHREPHRPHLAHHLVRAEPYRRGPVHLRLRRDERLGGQPRCDQLRPHRGPPHHAGIHAAHPRQHAQRSHRTGLPAKELARLRNR